MLLVDKLSFENRLKEVTFSLPSSGFFALMGRNGSGKTTLLKCLMGLLKASSGDISWNGQFLRHLSRFEIKQLIAFVPSLEAPALPFTVKEIVSMGRYGLPKDSLAIEEALEVAEVVLLQEKAVNLLSAGEKQRVYLARALAQKTPILFLDEPTSSLDFYLRAKIHTHLKKLKESGKFLLAATHDFELAELADETLLLEEGRLIHRGAFKKSLFGQFFPCERPLLTKEDAPCSF